MPVCRLYLPIFMPFSPIPARSVLGPAFKQGGFEKQCLPERCPDLYFYTPKPQKEKREWRILERTWSWKHFPQVGRRSEGEKWERPEQSSGAALHPCKNSARQVWGGTEEQEESENPMPPGAWCSGNKEGPGSRTGPGRYKNGWNVTVCTFDTRMKWNDKNRNVMYVQHTGWLVVVIIYLYRVRMFTPSWHF